MEYRVRESFVMLVFGGVLWGLCVYCVFGRFGGFGVLHGDLQLMCREGLAPLL